MEVDWHFHHSWGCVVCLDVRFEIILADGLDVFCCSENGAAQRAMLVGSAVEVVEQQLLLVFFNLKRKKVECEVFFSAHAAARIR